MISVVVDKKNVSLKEILVDNIADINHIKNVFRKSCGEKIRAVDGEHEYLCEILEIDSKKIILGIIKKKRDSFSINVEIDAGICLLKNDKMDLTIQKLTELGIRKIIPINSKRTVAKLDKKKDKWDTIVKESLKQCQAIIPTDITEIKKIKYIDYTNYDLVLIPYENEEENSIKKILSNLEKKPKKILYIIGPEGGFDKDEVRYFQEQGFKIISLGKRILRAETAAIVVGGVLINEFQ